MVTSHVSHDTKLISLKGFISIMTAKCTVEKFCIFNNSLERNDYGFSQ